MASLGLLLFTLAGRVDIVGFWLYIGMAILYQVVSLLVIVPRYPAYVDLDEARKAQHADVKAWDKEGVEVTSTVLDTGSLAVVDSPTDGTTQAALSVLVRAGEQDKSPYKITFYAVTTASPIHKWEIDLKRKIKELQHPPP